MKKELIKSAAAHRRLARASEKRLRALLRGAESSFTVNQLANHIDANRRCSKMDLEAAR